MYRMAAQASDAGATPRWCAAPNAKRTKGMGPATLKSTWRIRAAWSCGGLSVRGTLGSAPESE